MDHQDDKTSRRDSVWLHLMDVPFQYGWVDAGGIKTRYLEAGPKGAPVLIMLHGTGGSLETFCANIGEHAKHFHCFAIDMIGHGLSDKAKVDLEIPVYIRHVSDFMDTMKIERASFMGCSLGAWLATRLAIEKPEKVEKLVLIAPGGAIVNPQTMGNISSLRFKAVDEPTWENVKDVLRPLFYDEADIMDDLIAVRQKFYHNPEMNDSMRRILVLQDPAIRPRNIIREEEWTKISAPALFIQTPDDPGDYHETAMEAPAKVQHGQGLEIVHAKHWPHFEAPDKFNQGSISFLTST